MIATLKNVLERTIRIDKCRIQQVQVVGQFQRLYKVEFLFTTWKNENGEIVPLSEQEGISSSERILDPRFVTALEAGQGNPEFFDTPNPFLEGATPNQVLQQFNPLFFGIMEGLDFEIIDVAF